MKKILILGGGISKERKISLETAKQVNKVLNRSFKTFICEPNNDLIKKIKTLKPDLIFNALHGRFGEDGYIQSILEKLKMISNVFLLGVPVVSMEKNIYWS